MVYSIGDGKTLQIFEQETEGSERGSGKIIL